MRLLTQALSTEATVVIYESPFRVVDTLEAIQAVAGPQTRVVVARELTKIHEEIVRGAVEDVRAQLQGRALKGEVVILFHAEA